MTNEQFFVLRRTTVGPEVVGVTYKHVHCQQCGIRPVARIGSTKVRFHRKRDIVDFSRTQGGLLVQQHVIDYLTEAKVSGWRSGDVQVEKIKRLREIECTYRELVVIGQARNYTKYVKLEIFSDCQECGRISYKRPDPGELTIPKECWDGSDIFLIPELSGLFIVSKYAKEVLDDHHPTGVESIPVEDWYSII